MGLLREGERLAAERAQLVQRADPVFQVPRWVDLEGEVFCNDTKEEKCGPRNARIEVDLL